MAELLRSSFNKDRERLDFVFEFDDDDYFITEDWRCLISLPESKRGLVMKG